MTPEKPLRLFTQVLQQIIPIDASQSHDFFQHFDYQELQTDDFFVRKDQVCQRIGFIESGMIRHYYLHEGEEVTRWISLEHEFVTSLGSFILAKPCSHYLQAITPCRLWTIPKAVWMEQYQQHELLRSFWLRVMEFTVIGFEDRVYQQLASDAEQRYLYFMKYYPKFLEKVPQKYIASMIGIKPESLSRLRAKLAQKAIS